MSSIVSATSPQSWVNATPAWIHKPIFAFFLLLAAADIARRWLGLAWPVGWNFLSPAIWALGALTLSIGLARRLPAQNVGAIVVLASLLSLLVEVLNAATNLPFGHRAFTEQVGPRIMGVAWYQPLLWVSLAISGRGVARLILRPWRKLQYYGLWVMATATVLTLGMALAYEPFGSGAGWWWRENRADIWNWYSAPVASIFGWLITTLLIYGFTTPWFLNKQPVKQPTDWHPLVVWEALLIWLSVSNAFSGSWSAVLAGIMAGLVAAGMAIRGGTW